MTSDRPDGADHKVPEQAYVWIWLPSATGSTSGTN